MNRLMLKRLILLLLVMILALVACEEEQPTEEELLPTTEGDEPQAVAVNPPRVWIDSPLADTALIFDGSIITIVAHGSFLSGNAILSVADANGSILDTIALDQTEQSRAGSGILTRHEGQWLPQPQDAANTAPDGSVIYRLTVELSGVTSEPVILRMYQPTPTPSVTPSRTITPTETFTPTATESPTITASPSVTASPTSTATLTRTPSPTLTTTPSVTATNTVSPSPTASITASPSPTITASPTDRPSPTSTDTPTATITPTPTFTQEGTGTPEILFIDKVPGPCEFTAIRGQEVAARVGPGESRAARLFLDAGDTYTAIAYNNDFGVIWWQATIDAQLLWVDSNQVLESGNCADLVYATPPPVVVRPVEPVPTEDAPDAPLPPPGQPVIYYFTATPLDANYCTVLSWSVEFVDAVYLDGEGVVGMDSRQVCFPAGQPVSRTFTLVIYKNNAPVDSRTVTITSSGPIVTVTTPPPPTTPVPPTNQPPTVLAFSATACQTTGGLPAYISITATDPEGLPLRVTSATSSDTRYVRVTSIGAFNANATATIGFSCVFTYGDGYVSVNVTVTISDGVNSVSRTATIRARNGSISIR